RVKVFVNVRDGPVKPRRVKIVLSFGNVADFRVDVPRLREDPEPGSFWGLVILQPDHLDAGGTNLDAAKLAQTGRACLAAPQEIAPGSQSQEDDEHQERRQPALPFRTTGRSAGDRGRRTAKRVGPGRWRGTAATPGQRRRGSRGAHHGLILIDVAAPE